MPEIIPDKNTLRRVLLANRQAISAEVRGEWDEAIGERVLAHLAAHPAATLGVYWPIRGEPDLRKTYAELAARGMRLALPFIAAPDLPLRFAEWMPGDPLVKDALGVSIPATVIDIQPDALLIPCVGFNAGNIRLGYGGGFYDRTLAVTPRPLAIGIAYAFGLADFEGAAHDIALDCVITEQSPLSVVVSDLKIEY
jgi:5,10-methenyltetrahydrofolate synthetase